MRPAEKVSIKLIMEKYDLVNIKSVEQTLMRCKHLWTEEKVFYIKNFSDLRDFYNKFGLNWDGKLSFIEVH